MASSPTRRQIFRNMRAQVRDAIVLFHESRGALVLFFILVLGGALLFYVFYTDPKTGEPIGFSEALYGTFALLFFQNSWEFPEQWYLQLLYFVIPILGLVVVADGVIRFGVALTNKQERGQKWQIAMASTYNKHIILCGLGKVGYRVALELLKFGRDVIAIESNPDSRFIEKAKSRGIPVIIADARRTEYLIKANIKTADAVIPCTDDELTNLDIALDARELNPDVKVVMRLFDPDLARRVEKGFGIHTAFSTSALAAPIFATASMRVNVKTSFYVQDTLLNVSALTIRPGSALSGYKVRQLEEALDLSVICYTQGGNSILHPDSDLSLQAGADILVLGTLDVLTRLEDMNSVKG